MKQDISRRGFFKAAGTAAAAAGALSVTGAAPVADGKAVGFIENTAPIGLAVSTKNVKMTYGGKDYLLKSVKKPKIRIDTSTPTPSLTIDLQIEFIGNGFDDNAFISDQVKKSVSTLLADGYDVFGFSDLASKNFLTAKSFENFFKMHTP